MNPIEAWLFPSSRVAHHRSSLPHRRASSELVQRQIQYVLAVLTVRGYLALFFQKASSNRSATKTRTLYIQRSVVPAYLRQKCQQEAHMIKRDEVLHQSGMVRTFETKDEVVAVYVRDLEAPARHQKSRSRGYLLCDRRDKDDIRLFYDVPPYSYCTSKLKPGMSRTVVRPRTKPMSRLWLIILTQNHQRNRTRITRTHES